ncbi:hypothetical protein AKJ16_DCAP25646, partial [Drosera capensis]
EKHKTTTPKPSQILLTPAPQSHPFPLRPTPRRPRRRHFGGTLILHSLDGYVGPGDSTERSVQREPAVLPRRHRRLQFPHRLWLERSLRPRPPRTPLKCLGFLVPKSSLDLLFEHYGKNVMKANLETNVS